MPFRCTDFVPILKKFILKKMIPQKIKTKSSPPKTTTEVFFIGAANGQVAGFCWSCEFRWWETFPMTDPWDDYVYLPIHEWLIFMGSM